jgi:hypothetical protein
VPALASRPHGLIPSFSVTDHRRSERLTAERFAHPAGTALNHRPLDDDSLRLIATGLAQTATGGGHVWTEGTRRRYT